MDIDDEIWIAARYAQLIESVGCECCLHLAVIGYGMTKGEMYTAALEQTLNNQEQQPNEQI